MDHGDLRLFSAFQSALFASLDCSWCIFSTTKVHSSAFLSCFINCTGQTLLLRRSYVIILHVNVTASFREERNEPNQRWDITTNECFFPEKGKLYEMETPKNRGFCPTFIRTRHNVGESVSALTAAHRVCPTIRTRHKTLVKVSVPPLTAVGRVRV